MQHNIRPAKLSDAPALAELLRAVGYFEAINSKSSTEAAEQVRQHLTSDLVDQSHSVYVGVDEKDRISGYVAVHWLSYLFLSGPEGYISELFVLPSARGQGLGTALLEVVKAEARHRCCFRLALLNNRDRESYQRGFYQKHNWEERGVMANFVYWMEKEKEKQ